MAMFGVAGRHARRRASVASLSSTGLTPAASRALSRPSSANARRLSSASSSLTSLKPSSSSSSRSPMPSPSKTSEGDSPSPIAPSTRRRAILIQKEKNASGAGGGDGSSFQGILVEEAEGEAEEEEKDELRRSQNGRPPDTIKEEVEVTFSKVKSRIKESVSAGNLQIHAKEDLVLGMSRHSLGDHSEIERKKADDDLLRQFRGRQQGPKEETKSSKGSLKEADSGDEDDDNINGESRTRLPSISFEDSECPSGGSTRRLVRLSIPQSGISYRTRSVSPGYSGGAVPMRRRRAVGMSDHKSCAIVQNNMKMGLGDIM